LKRILDLFTGRYERKYSFREYRHAIC
jgi:hypothetical protein